MATSQAVGDTLDQMFDAAVATRDRDMRSLADSIKILVVGGVALVGVVAGTGPTFAQASDDCALAPLTLPLFAATPAAEVAATPTMLNDAPELDATTAETAMTQIVACSNNGDPAIAYAIFTERYLASLFADPDETYLPAFELSLEQGATQPARSLVLDEVVSVTPMPDGRVEVVATTTTNGTSYTDTFVLAWVDGVWLIDDVTNFDPAP